MVVFYTDLSFFSAPAISVQITTSGDPVVGQSGYSLRCNVEGTAEIFISSITYQWTKNNGTHDQIIPGNRANPEVLSFSPLKASNAGRYTCQVTISSFFLNNDITIVDSRNVTIERELKLLR